MLVSVAGFWAPECSRRRVALAWLVVEHGNADHDGCTAAQHHIERPRITMKQRAKDGCNYQRQGTQG